MPEDFSLSTKVGPLAIYQWVLVAGAAGFILFKLGFAKLAGGSSSSSSSPGQGDQFTSSQSQQTTAPNGDTTTSQYSASGNGYLPGELTTQASPMPYSLGDIYVNTNVASTDQTSAPSPSMPNLNLPDIRNAQGVDLGQYRFGQDEINYLTANKGSYGITQQLINDVQNKYNQMVQQVGAAAANNYHYGWYSAGNVTATPEFSTSGGTVIYPQATTQSSTQSAPPQVLGSSTPVEQKAA